MCIICLSIKIPTCSYSDATFPASYRTCLLISEASKSSSFLQHNLKCPLNPSLEIKESRPLFFAAQ
jgi:hypothetical protein